jgi:CubicO group peptidase (beta-lactamase class C family)
MIRIILVLVLVIMGQFVKAQTLYFPPLVGNQWDTISPQTLGWCPDKLNDLVDYVGNRKSKAFIILKDGKIVVEKYYGTFTQDSLWYWASAGKSLTSFLIGMAQQNGFLKLTDPTSKYLGNGWTSMTPTQESAVTVWNQLTMTSGLDDGVVEKDCTLPSCLIYKANPGTRWAYHNAPYTLLDKVIENATGQNLNSFFNARLRTPTGMSGLFLKSGSNNVFFSKARSMARFGLLVLNKGEWSGNKIMTDDVYFGQMTNTSQQINKSYGYLWWLNGKENFMLPGLQFPFSGSLFPNAPKDMISGLGRDAQYINIVPSQNLVVIRMGLDPSNSLVPITFNDTIWQKLNLAICTPNSTTEESFSELQVSPNPASSDFKIRGINGKFDVAIFDLLGRMVFSQKENFGETTIHLKKEWNGIHLVRILDSNGNYHTRKILFHYP